MYYVYILKCADNRTYIGSTNNLKDRFLRHQCGHVSATKDRIPVKLVAYFAFQDEIVTRKFEQHLKTGSGRAFIKKHKLV